MWVEAYAAFHPGEADVAGLPILVGIGFTEQLLELIVADPTAALRWSDAGLFQRGDSIARATYRSGSIPGTRSASVLVSRRLFPAGETSRGEPSSVDVPRCYKCLSAMRHTFTPGQILRHRGRGGWPCSRNF